MVDVTNKEKCCGCTACMNICPNGAIQMCSDMEGFKYPVIDDSKCVNCNACVRVCAYKNKNENYSMPVEIVAAKNKDNSVRASSSSGGVFSSLFKYVIENDGAVYGAQFDEQFVVKHARATTIEECETFKGAKYVQSDMNDIYTLVKNDLSQDKQVLFSGTPCQIAGLKSFLKNRNTDALITCDIICHGVPSPLIWKEYLNVVKSKNKIVGVTFRDKSNGWHHSELRIDREDGTYISENHSENVFSTLYFNSYIVRPSCAVCPYARIERVGDITIGDFWGIENSIPEFDDDKGTSLVLANTDKGMAILKKIMPDLEIRTTDYQHCLQPNLKAPSKLSGDREKVWRKYYTKGFRSVMKNYTPYGNQCIDIILKKYLFKIKNRLKKR